MAEESDARIERLEKDSQESRAQIAEMMELIKTLIRDKGQASGLDPQNETTQPDQKREEPVYPVGFTPSYALNIHMAQVPPMQQAGGFPYDYVPPLLRTNEVGQNSGANMADPIAVSDLNDPKKQEKMRKESSEQSESNEAQRKLDRKSTRLNSSHESVSRMPSSA